MIQSGICKTVLILTMVIFLAACGAKRPDEPEVAAVIPVDEDMSDLNGNERQALAATGQIDRHVPDHAMPAVAAQYKYFLRQGRNTMCTFSRRSEQYLAYARKVFRERGMPEDLAYLAIVESGYRPAAVSRAGAAGAWQFMPGTGERYGLKQDFWQDERLDPYKATEAAASYLQKLYNDFGDWPTAIAAYNAGEGKISRAKQGTGGKDFFEVNARNHMLDGKAQLREETRQYVPRFMAVTKIMRNLPQLGFDGINPDKAEPVARLTAKPGTDLKAAAKAAGMSWSDFASYNQHHKRNITCTDQHTYVYVPARVEKLAANYLCSAQAANYAGWKGVTVGRAGDTLESISKRTNAPLAMLQAANGSLERLTAGQTILAPANYTPPKAVRAKKAKEIKGKQLKSVSTALADAGKKAGRHVLKSNETLYSVSRKYNVSVQTLMAHNGISDAGRVRAGHALTIPGVAAKQAQAGGASPAKGRSSGKIGQRRATYTVQAKDSLWSIAKRHKISVDDLRRWNKISGSSLQPGASLVVASE